MATSMNPGPPAEEPNPVAVHPAVTNAAPKPAAAPITASLPAGIPSAPKVPQLKPGHVTPEGFEDVPLPNNGFKRRRIGTEKWRHHCACGPRLQYCKRGCKGIRQQQKTTPEGFEDIPLETGGFKRRRIGSTGKGRNYCACGTRFDKCKRGCKCKRPGKSRALNNGMGEDGKMGEVWDAARHQDYRWRSLVEAGRGGIPGEHGMPHHPGVGGPYGGMPPMAGGPANGHPYNVGYPDAYNRTMAPHDQSAASHPPMQGDGTHPHAGAPPPDYTYRSHAMLEDLMNMRGRDGSQVRDRLGNRVPYGLPSHMLHPNQLDMLYNHGGRPPMAGASWPPAPPGAGGQFPPTSAPFNAAAGTGQLPDYAAALRNMDPRLKGAMPAGVPATNGLPAAANGVPGPNGEAKPADGTVPAASDPTAELLAGGTVPNRDTHLYGKHVMIHGTKLEGSKGVVTGYLKDTNEYVVSIVVNGLSYEMGVLSTNISVLDEPAASTLPATATAPAPVVQPASTPFYATQAFAAGAVPTAPVTTAPDVAVPPTMDGAAAAAAVAANGTDPAAAAAAAAALAASAALQATAPVAPHADLGAAVALPVAPVAPVANVPPNMPVTMAQMATAPVAPIVAPAPGVPVMTGAAPVMTTMPAEAAPALPVAAPPAATSDAPAAPIVPVEPVAPGIHNV